MLYREDPAGIIVIGQPAHAWIAGQLAWGNEHVGTVAPWEEVCLTAEQHDMAYALWERAPTLNPQTGRPYSFLDMPTNVPANSSQEWEKNKALLVPALRLHCQSHNPISTPAGRFDKVGIWLVRPCNLGPGVLFSAAASYVPLHQPLRSDFIRDVQIPDLI
jgi:Protein of unknown function (DUF3891)